MDAEDKFIESKYCLKKENFLVTILFFFGGNEHAYKAAVEHLRDVTVFQSLRKDVASVCRDSHKVLKNIPQIEMDKSEYVECL